MTGVFLNPRFVVAIVLRQKTKKRRRITSGAIQMVMGTGMTLGGKTHMVGTGMTLDNMVSPGIRNNKTLVRVRMWFCTFSIACF